NAAFATDAKMDDPVQMYLNDVFTVTVNLAGLPGLSVPAGLSSEGLPLGLQVIGRAFDETTVLRVGKALEDAAGFDSRPGGAAGVLRTPRWSKAGPASGSSCWGLRSMRRSCRTPSCSPVQRRPSAPSQTRRSASSMPA